MASASTCPSTSRASDKSCAAQSERAAKRTSVPPEPGFGSTSACPAAICRSSSHTFTTPPLRSFLDVAPKVLPRWRRPIQTRTSRSLCPSAPLTHLGFLCRDDIDPLIAESGEYSARHSGSGLHLDRHLEAAATDGVIALRRNELRLGQIENQSR